MKGYLIKDNYFQNLSFTFTFLFKQIILEVQPLLMLVTWQCLCSVFIILLLLFFFFPPGYLFEYHITRHILHGNLVIITDNVGYQGHKQILC